MRNKNLKFITVLSIILIVIASSIFGGYLLIDKVLVPKYFGAYGIDNLDKLVEIVQTIYQVPEETEIITNGFQKSDFTSSTEKLKLAGFPVLKNGEIDYEKIGKYEYTLNPDPSFKDNFIILTDKEAASVLSEIISSGLLVSNFPELSYIDTLKMEVKQLNIVPINTEIESTNYSNTAEQKELTETKNIKLSMTIKLDTSSAKSQIADNLKISPFLIDLVIPNEMYLTASVEIEKDFQNNIFYKNATLAVNNKTPKQSELLLNLLIRFIYPEDQIVSIENLSNYIGQLATVGIKVLGDSSFVYNDKDSTKCDVKINLDINIQDEDLNAPEITPSNPSEPETQPEE